MNQNLLTRYTGLFFPCSKGWIYLLSTCSLLFMSCSRYYYAPNSVPIPLLKEKEANINAQIDIGTRSTGFECQSAFAITSHFGGMVNMMVSEGEDFDDDYSYYGSDAKTNISFIELGAGYFTPIKSSSFVFETYAGLGTGGVRNYYDPGNSTVRFTKLFIQPNIGFKNKHIEFGIASKMSWVNHKVISSDPPEDRFSDELDYLQDQAASFLWEPGFVLRAGGKNFKFQFQYTTSVNLTHTSDSFSQETDCFAFGFNIPIHYKTKAQ